MPEAPNLQSSSYDWFVTEFTRHVEAGKEMVERRCTWKESSDHHDKLVQLERVAKEKGLNDTAISNAKRAVLTEHGLIGKRG